MTPSEKANEIFRKHYHNISGIPPEHKTLIFSGDTLVEVARKCAIITLDEILGGHVTGKYSIEYWEQVRQEIREI